MLEKLELKGTKQPGNERIMIRKNRQLATKMILESLSDNNWEYRTVDGIANELQLNEKFVKRFLEGSGLVRRSFAKSPYGKDLYTLKSRISVWKDLLGAVRSINSIKY